MPSTDTQMGLRALRCLGAVSSVCGDVVDIADIGAWRDATIVVHLDARRSRTRWLLKWAVRR